MAIMHTPIENSFGITKCYHFCQENLLLTRISNHPTLPRGRV